MRNKLIVCLSLIIVFIIGYAKRYVVYDLSCDVVRLPKTIPNVENDSKCVDELFTSFIDINYFQSANVEDADNSIIRRHNKELILNRKTSFISQIDKNYDGKDYITYIVRYDFDLNGKSVHLPRYCKLKFDGGSLRNGTIIGDESDIVAEKGPIMQGIDIIGSWTIKRIYSSWFNDIFEDNALKKLFALTSDTIDNTVYIEKGEYNVSAAYNKDEILIVKSNSNIVIDGNILLKPNAFDNYQVFRIAGKKNVRISGNGSLIGDRYLHLSTEGESGHGIVLRESNNIYISGLSINSFWGDGITIGGASGKPCENVIVDSCIIANARRNGVSIVYANRFRVSNNVFYGNEGTAPERAIDIEANPGCYCTNGIILKNDIKGKYGISTALEGSGGNYVKNISIKENTIDCYAGEYSTPYGRSISLLGDPENVIVEKNVIVNGGIFAGSSSISKKIIVRNNDISGKARFDCIRCTDNIFNSVAIQCIQSVFIHNTINSDSSQGSGNGETAIVCNASVVADNTINLLGGKYVFDCPITSRRDSEIRNNTINVSDNAKVRYSVRVLSGSKTVIERNRFPNGLKVIDMGIDTVIN